jgi:hypothetical protein
LHSIEQVFDTGVMAELARVLDPAIGRPALDRAVIEKIAPITLSGQRTLAVPELLQPLFPWGGVQPGTSVAVAGHGSWSLALAIMAEALGSEGWLAVVGVPDLGLSAAAELGVRLDRVLMVETPSVAQWPTVVAALLEAVQIVAIAPGDRVGSRDARRLTARAREQGSVLLHLDGARSWPTTVDVSLTTQAGGWEGLGDGHGHLRCRRVMITSSGRRGAAAGASVDVLLPGPNGRLAPAVSGADVLAFRRETAGRR